MKTLVRLFFGFALISFFALTAAAQSQWTRAKTASAGSDLNTVYFADAKRGWIAGDNGYLAFTNDGGETWTPQNIGTKDAVSDVYFRSADKGYVIASDRIFSSIDGGQKWREEKVVLPRDVIDGKPEFYSLRFANKKNGWIVGSVIKNEQVVGSLVLHSDDAGLLWRRVSVPTKAELIHVDFINENTGWIVGANGTILKTADAGKTWTAQKSYASGALYHVDFKNEDLGWAVGEKGLILRTENGGLTWQRIVSNQPKALLSVEFVNDKTGWIVGRGGVILRSDDAGRTWTKQNSQTADNLFALYIDKKVGWAVGGKGTILRYER